MYKTALSPVKVLLFGLIIILHFSCTKDTDLLTENIIFEDKIAFADIVQMERGGNGPNPNASKTGDDDGDGVRNELDDCPFTPAGAKVNKQGCAASQYDTDDDGVIDSQDQCPDTPAGASVDGNGCSISQKSPEPAPDDDQDGVSNDRDICPNTPTNSSVNNQGCSNAQWAAIADDDGDGVTNDRDDCPGTPSGESANSEGCSQSQLNPASDDDNDGVPNEQDDCPFTPAGASVNNFGCASSQYDTDGDGVTDNLDECPGTPAGEAVNGNGCPADSSLFDDEHLGELIAFPGAEGFGRFTTGGRGGSVYQVTNLNDSGPGSFREAVSKGDRTIVFKVGGVIKITSPVNFGGSNITIAGQTAPGEGIAIYGSMVDSNQHENIIIRYVNFLAGDNARLGDDDSFRLRRTNPGTASNFIFDHCGFYWGKDENIGLEANSSETSSIDKVTFQKCIIAESLHDRGMILWRQNFNISIIGNLFANNSMRSIRASTRYSTFEMINNVIYNYNWATNPTYNNVFDIIGNVYISSSNNNVVTLEASLNNKPNGSIANTLAHIFDNTLNGGSIKISSNLNPYLKSSRQVNSGYTPIPNSAVMDYVLNDVGANHNGNNKLAQSQIDDVLNNTGSFISSESESVGISLSGGTAYSDADEDGMSDEWESANGLNPNDPSDRNGDLSGDGYTNLESFLHALTER